MSVLMKKLCYVSVLILAFTVVGVPSGFAKKPSPTPTPTPEPTPEPTSGYKLTLIYGPQIWPEGMNSSGDLVGDHYPDGVKTAFLYTAETAGAIDLNTLLPSGSGWFLKEGWDINDQGQIVGSGELDGQKRGFRFTPERIVDGVVVPAEVTDMGSLNTDDEYVIPRGINEAGNVCGSAKDAAGNNYSWYYTDALGMQPLLSGIASGARAINNNGMILGVLYESPYGAFRIIIPGSDPEFFYAEGTYFEPQDMNSSGEFAGTAGFMVEYRKNRFQMRSRAIRHDGNQIFDLGAGDYSAGWGINDAGDVVGIYDRDATTGRFPGFVYLADEQRLQSLDSVVSGSSEDLAVWFASGSRTQPDRINNAGQIGGFLMNSALSDNTIGFLLTPVVSE